MDDIREKLDKEIEARLDKLSTMDNKVEREEEISQIVDLYKLRLDDKKLDNEKDVQTFGRKFKLALETAGLVVPNGILIFSIAKGFLFEKEGVFVRSDTLRRLLGSVKPSRFVKMFR